MTIPVADLDVWQIAPTSRSFRARCATVAIGVPRQRGHLAKPLAVLDAERDYYLHRNAAVHRVHQLAEGNRRL